MSKPAIVLVHGAFVDGSGWQQVYDLLVADGFTVRVVQNSTLNLTGDVAVTHQVIAGIDGPVVLVGHSYGGVVITEAGTHPQVAALVYVAAFAPDNGESVQSLIPEPEPGADVPPIIPIGDGFLGLDRGGFHQAFAADLPAELAAFMADSQQPWGVEALGTPVSEAAWHSKPSWFVVATDDHMIPPPGQEGMAARAGATVTKVAASHAVYVSQPGAVADVIRSAAEAVSG